MIPEVKILQGDCLEVLKTLEADSVHCCVTSPPYWGLRDYGCAGQIGLEATPQEYVTKMVEVFAEVRRVLRGDGTCWVNLGDSYSGGGNYRGINSESTLASKQASNRGAKGLSQALGAAGKETGVSPKNLIGIPWRVAFALQADSWYLRSDIIWSKPNPMPESVTDRPTKAHEYIFLLTKSERYAYDADAIKEPSVSDHDSGNGFDGRQGGADHLPMSGGVGSKEPWTRGKKSWNGSEFHDGCNLLLHPNVGKNRSLDANSSGRRMVENVADARANGADHDSPFGETRNKRSVWTVSTQCYKDAHFATFPPDLIKPCILAGSPPGGIVLDPFGGSGTTGMVARELGRASILIELNPEYVKLADRRCDITPGFSFA